MVQRRCRGTQRTFSVTTEFRYICSWAKLKIKRHRVPKYNGNALHQAVAAEKGTGTDSFLAHHDDASSLAASFYVQVEALIRKGVNERDAAQMTAVNLIAPAVHSEVQRKIQYLRREAQTHSGYAALLSTGLIQKEQVLGKILEWETGGVLSKLELDKEWERLEGHFEDLMCRNINARAFNEQRRAQSLEAARVSSIDCQVLLHQAAGQSMLTALANIGVGHLDNFADPAAVQSLHNWLMAAYNENSLFRKSADPCNKGSFFTGLEFEVHDALQWSTAPKIPPNAASVLAKFVGVAAELEKAFDIPFRIEKKVHVGVYPAGGAAYSRHLDRYDFEEIYNRTVTCLLYTNPEVSHGPTDRGGELRVYPPTPGAPVSSGISSKKYVDFKPLANRLVCFWSRTVFHEVLPTHGPGPPRLALTIWVMSGGNWKPKDFRRYAV